MFQKVDGRYYLELDIAHICAAEQNGPRYDPNMTDQQKTDFPNLIFLCRPHHKAVDNNNGEDYPVEMLRQWKAERESSTEASLRAGGLPITVETLERVVNNAVIEQNKRIEATLSRLEQNDQEAAALMQDLLDQLTQIRSRQGAAIDPDSVAMLDKATRRFGYLTEHVEHLDRVTRKLGDLEPLINDLNSAANKISDVRYYM